MKWLASRKGKEDNVPKARSFANVVKYRKDVSRVSGNEDDRNVDESFKSEILKEMEMRFN